MIGLNGSKILFFKNLFLLLPRIFFLSSKSISFIRGIYINKGDQKIDSLNKQFSNSIKSNKSPNIKKPDSNPAQFYRNLVTLGRFFTLSESHILHMR